MLSEDAFRNRKGVQRGMCCDWFVCWFIPTERKRIQISLVRRLCGGGVGTDHKHGEAMRSFLSTIFLEKKVVNFEAVTVALLCVRPHHTSIL